MVKQIRALARGLAVVRAIGAADGPVTLGQLHRATGLDRATLLRILATLSEEGWLYRGIGDNRYRLAYRLHDLGAHMSIHDAVAEVAAPVLDRLQKALRWPSDVSVFDGDGMAIIETSRRRTPFVINREVLGYKPGMLQSAMGRAYLAYCDARQREHILKVLRRKGGKDAELAGDQAYVARVLAEVRDRGYATRDPGMSVLSSDVEEGVCAIAVPILVFGDVQATLNLVWMKGADEKPDIESRFFLELKPAAEELAELFHRNELY